MFMGLLLALGPEGSNNMVEQNSWTKIACLSPKAVMRLCACKRALCIRPMKSKREREEGQWMHFSPCSHQLYPSK